MGAERYVILGTLGSDPTGTTFLALESELDQRVVYKRFTPALARDAAFTGGLRQEARLMALFDHPNLVSVLDFFAETELVVVAEYVRGASLRAAVEQGGRMTPGQAIRSVKGVLQALAYAHDLGLVHRDIRAENVLADSNGVIKLTAFGQTPKRLGRTRAGDIPGRIAATMSPERMSGGAVGPLTDIYSCGALLYQLLTGERPYAGEDIRSVLRQHLQGPVPDPGLLVRSLPEEIAALVTRAMARAPEDRPESADLFLHELEAAAVSAYGPDWESKASIDRLVRAAAASLAGALTLDEAAQSTETIETEDSAPLSRGRRFAAIGAAFAVLLASAGALAYATGAVGPARGPASLVSTPSPVPEVSTSPSPSPLPTPSASPSASPSRGPTAAPAPSAPARPPVLVGPAKMSVTNVHLWFAPCFSAQNCAPPLRGDTFDPSHPFDASGYGYMTLMDAFDWSYVSGSEAVVASVTTSSESAAGPYPGHTSERILPLPGGSHTPDGATADFVISTASPSVSSGNFVIKWTDSTGPHTEQSATFFWRH